MSSKFNKARMMLATAIVALVTVPALAEARDGGRVANKRPAHVPAGNSTRTTTRQRSPTGHTRQDTWTKDNGKTASRDVAVVNDKEAGTRTRDATWTGPNGGTGTASTVTQKTDTGYTRNTTATNAQGQTATRSAVVTRDAETGTRSVSADRTGFDGRTTSYDSERQRTENGYTQQDTWTRDNGKTVSRDVAVSNDKEAGTNTRDATWKGPNGGTGTVNTVTQKTDNGYTRSTTAANAQGETATRSAVVTRDAEAGTRSVSVDRVGPNGGTSSYDSVRQRTEDGYTREVTETLKNGETRTRSIDVSCDKDAKSCVKTVENNGGANPP